jgi:hypothetical protein
MDLNADFTRPAVAHAASLPWIASPMAGVERRMLDRLGEEVARATSIVRYAPGSHFSPHVHDGGEEFLVLEGVFQDEHGDYPAGSYIRNPPTSSHTPGSQAGCVIFVKLWQFDPADRTQVQLDTAQVAAEPDPARPGVALTPLFADACETVRLELWAPDAEVRLPAPGGLELLVLAGEFRSDEVLFTGQSWLRLPPGAALKAQAGPSGCRLWMKTGHLARAQTAPRSR